jgi:hypothetical protein
MNETRTVRRLYRAFPAGACLALCALLGFVLWLCLGVAGALGTLLLVAISIGYALAVGSLIVHLLYCWRHRLQIDSRRIVNRGLLGVTEICLADVTEVDWIPEGPGGVVLKTNFDKVPVLFARYSPDASLRIIQFLREALAKSIQQEWNRFCLRIAIPLRNPDSDTRQSEVVFSRAQFDRLFSSLFFADLAVAALYWQVGILGNWTITVLPLALTGLFWVTVRYFVPVRTVTKVGWFPLALFVDVLVDHLAWAFRLFGLVMLCCAFLVGIPRGLELATVVVVTAGIFEVVRRSLKHWRGHKEQRDYDLAHSETAVREWELLDQAGAGNLDNQRGPPPNGRFLPLVAEGERSLRIRGE